MLRKKLPKHLREAAERGRARFLAPKVVEEPKPSAEEILAQREIEQAREWVKKSLPGIIESCAARGESDYCLGWCEEKSVNQVRRRAFACEEANLVISTYPVFELKPVKGEDKRDRTKITKDDIQTIIFFVLEWEL